MASGRLFQGFPGGGEYAQVPAKSGESRSSGLGCGLLRVGWEPVSSLKLVCPSGRQNPNHLERSVSSWHWSCGLPHARGWWCQGRE